MDQRINTAVLITAEQAQMDLWATDWILFGWKPWFAHSNFMIRYLEDNRNNAYFEFGQPELLAWSVCS